MASAQHCKHPVEEIKQVSFYELKCSCCGKSWHAPDVSWMLRKIQELTERVEALESELKETKHGKPDLPANHQKKAVEQEPLLSGDASRF